MKTFTSSIFLLSLLLINTQIYAQDANQMLQKQSKQFFIENKGQWDSEVLYLTKIGGLNAWITKTGVVYDYYKIEKEEKQDNPDILHLKDVAHLEDENSSIKGHVVKMEFGNPTLTLPTGEGKGNFHFFKKEQSINNSPFFIGGAGCFFSRNREIRGVLQLFHR